MHRILERQLKRFAEAGGILPVNSESLFKEISEAYAHFDEDRTLIERSLDISSKELGEINQKLRNESKYVESQVVERTHELHEARARLLASINSLELGFLITENTTGINTLNNAAARVLQLPQEQTWTLVQICEVLKENFNLQHEINLCFYHQTSAEFNTIAFKDRFLHFYLSPIVLEEVAIGCAILLEDVTEKKIIERSRDEFFSIASHELRTPLTAIRGFNEVLHTLYSAKLQDPQFDKIISNIDKGSKRLITIVNDFLSMSGLEQGKISFNMEPTDLREIVQSQTQELQAMAQSHNLDLVINWPDWHMPTVRADRDRLKQVLTNLVGNAIKFTSSGNIAISFERKDNLVEVNITDTGKGISPQHQNLLFRKFQQAGESILTRDASNGTGLGLYISKMIVEGMGGAIYLKFSEPGKGSTFAFTIPILQHS